MQLKGKQAGKKYCILACPLCFALHASSARGGTSQQDSRAGCCWLQKPIHKNIGFSLGDAKGQLTTELNFDPASVSKTKMPPNLSQWWAWQFLFPLNSGHLRDSVAKYFTIEPWKLNLYTTDQLLKYYYSKCNALYGNLVMTKIKTN